MFTSPFQMVSNAAISPDQTVIATADSEAVITLWNTADGSARRLTGHSEAMTVLKFDDRGEHVLSVSYDGTARVWDAATGEGRVVPTDGAAITSTFVAGGRVVVAGTAVVLSTVEGTPEATLQVGERIIAATVSPGSDVRVALGSNDGTVYLWKPGEISARTIGDVDTRILDLEFVEDGNILLSRTGDEIVEWNLSSDTKRSLSHTESRAMSVSSDEKHVAVCGTDGLVRVVSRRDDTVRELVGHHGPCTAIAFAPTGDRLVTGGEDGTVRVWSLDGQVGVTVHRHDEAVTAVVWAADARTLVSTSYDGITWMGDAGDAEFLAAEPSTLLRAIADRTTASID
jgi:WD40 repeat protein